MIAWMALVGVVLIALYLVYDHDAGKAWGEDLVRRSRRQERKDPEPPLWPENPGEPD